MPRSLYARLALALLGLLAVVAVLFVATGIYTTEMYLQEVRQKLNRDLAAHLIDDGLLLSDGRVEPEVLENVIHMLMVVNPSIEVYVLDTAGTIVAFSSPPGAVKRESVSLGPVREFLGSGGESMILGDDPRNPGGRKVFSASAIGDADNPEGYVYVVLGGQLHDSVVERLAASYTMKMGIAAGIAVLLFAVAAGLLIFSVLTRRLRRLAAAVGEFEAGGFSSPELLTDGRGGSTGEDEIDHLAGTFREMAGRLAEQLTETEKADSLRRELVANVSHDLRTPLATLHGYLETILLKGEDLAPDERRRYLEIAARHSRRLGKRVADLFELSKLEARDIEPNREMFSMAELVQDVVQKFDLQAESKNIDLETERHGDQPLIEGDISLLERVLENLIGNAIRHTPENGRITVAVCNDPGGVRVDVTDSGPGIPEDELSSLFHRFFKGRSEESVGGTGLGLAISRKIVELHGGDLSAANRPGGGAVFSFTLPA